MLLLLHGLGATGDVWNGWPPVLSERWPGRWLAPDLPGHGGSEPLPRYSFGDLAASLVDLVGPGDQLTVLGLTLAGRLVPGHRRHRGRRRDQGDLDRRRAGQGQSACGAPGELVHHTRTGGSPLPSGVRAHRVAHGGQRCRRGGYTGGERTVAAGDGSLPSPWAPRTCPGYSRKREPESPWPGVSTTRWSPMTSWPACKPPGSPSPGSAITRTSRIPRRSPPY